VYKLLTFAHVVIKIALAHKTKLDARFWFWFGLEWFGFISPLTVFVSLGCHRWWACFLRGPPYISDSICIAICVCIPRFVFCALANSVITFQAFYSMLPSS